jgi:tetratricopeptide (TPR) repeat protein
MIADPLPRAIALHQAGKLDQAEGLYRAALAVEPDNVNALHLLGVLCQHQGRAAEAVRLFEAALRLDPKAAAAHGNLGNALRALGRLDAAAASYRQALRLAPDQAELHFGFATVLREQQRWEAAVSQYQQAYRLRPDLPEAAIHLCRELAGQGWLDLAESLLRGMVKRDPRYVGAWVNLGRLQQLQGRFPAALDCYRKAQAIAPDFALAHYNEALILLLTGNYASGWPKYEWRWWSEGFVTGPQRFTQPRWTGEELDGGTLLLHSEQGYGDTIQFCRYVPLAAARARVLLSVPRPLVRLLSGLPGVGGFVCPGDPMPDFARHCPLLSLPGVFGTNAATIPAQIPYLAAEPALVEAWAARLPATGCRIGVVWQGNPDAAPDRERSFPLASFEAIAQVPGVTLVSLQYGAGLEQLDAMQGRFPIAVPGPDFNGGSDAFIDTAAVMMSLDLVITCDTAAAHLAGALGRPVWLLLRRWPDWRWLLERPDSPWYPSMRLFRQRRADGWAEVFARVVAALPEFMENRTSR